jgi:hypothetical protein
VTPADISAGYLEPHAAGPVLNGRKVSANSGLLRNSTKIAAQFLGLGQCSQTSPETDENLKQRPDGSGQILLHGAPGNVANGMKGGNGWEGLPRNVRPRLAEQTKAGPSASIVRVQIFRGAKNCRVAQQPLWFA